MARHVADAYDPEGERHALPTWPYGLAPAGLSTVRQLRAKGLRPNGQPPAGQLIYRHGSKEQHALLYRDDLAAPKRTATDAQMVAIGKALLARTLCKTCDEYADYFIPRRYGQCLHCEGII